MINKQEKAYRTQLKRCYKRRRTEKKDWPVRQRVAWIFWDMYQRRDKTVNGEYRPGNRWTRKQLGIASELMTHA